MDTQTLLQKQQSHPSTGSVITVRASLNVFQSQVERKRKLQQDGESRSKKDSTGDGKPVAIQTYSLVLNTGQTSFNPTVFPEPEHFTRHPLNRFNTISK